MEACEREDGVKGGRTGAEKDDALGKRGSYHPFRNPSLLNLRPGSLDPVTPLALCQWSLASSLEKGASPQNRAQALRGDTRAGSERRSTADPTEKCVG